MGQPDPRTDRDRPGRRLRSGPQAQAEKPQSSPRSLPFAVYRLSRRMPRGLPPWLKPTLVTQIIKLNNHEHTDVAAATVSGWEFKNTGGQTSPSSSSRAGRGQIHACGDCAPRDSLAKSAKRVIETGSLGVERKTQSSMIARGELSRTTCPQTLYHRPPVRQNSWRLQAVKANATGLDPGAVHSRRRLATRISAVSAATSSYSRARPPSSLGRRIRPKRWVNSR